MLIQKKKNYLYILFFVLITVLSLKFYYHVNANVLIVCTVALSISYYGMLTRTIKKWIYLLSFVIAVYWSISTKNTYFALTMQFLLPFFLTILMYTIWFSVFINFFSQVKINLDVKKTDRVIKLFSVCSWTLIFSTWLFYLLSFYPGFMTDDSFAEWSQANGYGVLSEWHPLIHVFFISLCNKVYFSPATFLFLQILAASIVIVYILTKLLKNGMPMILVVLISVLYAFYPINGYYMSTLWKDIPYAILMLFFFYLTYNLVIKKAQVSYLYLIVYVFIAFLTALFRKNGLYVIMGTSIYLLFYLRNKKILLIVVMVVSSILSFNFYTSNILHAEKSPTSEAFAIPLQQVAATYKNNGKISRLENQYFEQILPLESWKKNYKINTVDSIKFDPKFRKDIIEKNPRKFLENWYTLLVKNPHIFVSAYLNQTASIWRFFQPTGTEVYILGVRPMGWKENYYQENIVNPLATDVKIKEMYGEYKKDVKKAGAAFVSYRMYKKRLLKAYQPLYNNSKINFGQQKLQKVYWKNYSLYQKYLVRSAVAVLLLLLTTAICLVKYNFWETVGIMLPPYLNLLSLIASVPATDFRYIYSLNFSIILIFVVIIYDKRLA